MKHIVSLLIAILSSANAQHYWANNSIFQVIGMLFHRAETFNHIVATTSLGGVGNKSDELARMFISDAIELTRNLGLDDSDRSSMASSMSEFDSGNYGNR